jgi:hypothetical protein
VPRRSRGHVYRKRTVPPPAARESERTVAEEIQEEEVAEDGAVFEPVSVPAPYIRRQPSVTTARTGAAAAPRPSRALIADYGYVVSEMKRIGITFAGLIILLIVIARLLVR